MKLIMLRKRESMQVVNNLFYIIKTDKMLFSYKKREFFFFFNFLIMYELPLAFDTELFVLTLIVHFSSFDWWWAEFELISQGHARSYIIINSIIRQKAILIFSFSSAANGQNSYEIFRSKTFSIITEFLWHKFASSYIG